jgi:hypothetical protein
MFEGGRMLKLSPTGELLQQVQLPLRCPTAVCFGGPDLRTLYVTSASHGRPAEELAQYPHSGKVLALGGCGWVGDAGVSGLSRSHNGLGSRPAVRPAVPLQRPLRIQLRLSGDFAA